MSFLQLQRVVLALVALCSFLAPGDDEIVGEFRRYFRKYKDTASRVEAVLALGGTESTGVVEVLVPLLADADGEVSGAAARVLASFQTNAPVAALFEELEGSSREPIRLGILRVVAAGEYAARQEGAGEALAACLADSSWQVRRLAIEALCAAGVPGVDVTVLVLPLAADREPAVRCSALEGLARRSASEVLVPARAALTDDVWQVRASAIAALAAVRDKASIPLLIDRLAAEEGRLRGDAAKALEDLTGRTFGERVELWQRFWQQNGERYVLPTDAEMKKLLAARAASAVKYQGSERVSFSGIDTPSKRVIFVIDVSGSMERFVVEKDRFESGDYPSFHRIDIVKTELSRTVELLEPYVEFNVLAFATQVRSWKKTLVPANVLNKSSAEGWIGRLEAIGGSSQQQLAEAGLVGAANLEAGKTNSYSALMAALGVEEDGRAKDYRVDVDTIFFLSDGEPSAGEYTVPEDILREVREQNALRKIVIHTIAIGEFQMQFMEELAAQNGGQFVHLGG